MKTSIILMASGLALAACGPSLQQQAASRADFYDAVAKGIGERCEQLKQQRVQLWRQIDPAGEVPENRQFFTEEEHQCYVDQAGAAGQARINRELAKPDTGYSVNPYGYWGYGAFATHSRH